MVGRRLVEKSLQKKQPKYSCSPFCSARGDTLEWQVHSGVCRLASPPEPDRNGVVGDGGEGAVGDPESFEISIE